MKQNDFEILNVADMPTPALAVYPAVVKSNIQSAVAIAGNNILRPHIKTCKTPELVQMMQDAGISHFKCATIAEAELLGMQKATDVLLACQPVDINIKRLKQLIITYRETVFSCLVDNITTLAALDEIFDEAPIAVFIDLNAGMNRTGTTLAQASNLMDACLKTKGVLLKGIHVYDGDINDLDITQRTAYADKVYEKANIAKEKAAQKTGRKMELVIGGTPTFAIHAKQQAVQCSPGTFILWDAGYSAFSDLPFTVAAVLITRIISIIDDKQLCLDLGHKAVASENPLHKRLKFLTDDPVELISHSEEHLVVKVANTGRYNIGDVWYAVPYHICPTVALHHKLQVIENGYCTKEWEVIARNRKINF